MEMEKENLITSKWPSQIFLFLEPQVDHSSDIFGSPKIDPVTCLTALNSEIENLSISSSFKISNFFAIMTPDGALFS